MLLEKRLMPDLVLNNYQEVTPTLVEGFGADAILCDIDNTLATYDDLVPAPEVRAWVDALCAAGIRLILVSNNTPERVERFAAPLGVPYVPDIKKPAKKPYLRVMKKYRLTPEKTVCLGDQLLTDVWAAKNLGMRAIIVPPIKDKTSLFFKFKRWVEKPYLRKYRKLHKETSGKS